MVDPRSCRRGTKLFEVLQNLKRALDGSGKESLSRQAQQLTTTVRVKTQELSRQLATSPLRGGGSLLAGTANGGYENNNRTTSPPSSSSDNEGIRRNPTHQSCSSHTTGSALQSQKPTWKTSHRTRTSSTPRWKHQIHERRFNQNVFSVRFTPGHNRDVRSVSATIATPTPTHRRYIRTAPRTGPTTAKPSVSRASVRRRADSIQRVLLMIFSHTTR